MPMDAENVSVWGQTGSGRRTVKMMRFEPGILDSTRLLHVRCQPIEKEIKIKTLQAAGAQGH
jgi:hypothetical protein